METTEGLEGSRKGGMIRALLIEDDRKLAGLLTEFLGQHGVEAVVAPGGVQALQQIGQGRVGILLVALILPGMDGFTHTPRLPPPPNPPPLHWTRPGPPP